MLGFCVVNFRVCLDIKAKRFVALLVIVGRKCNEVF